MILPTPTSNAGENPREKTEVVGGVGQNCAYPDCVCPIVLRSGFHNQGRKGLSWRALSRWLIGVRLIQDMQQHTRCRDAMRTSLAPIRSVNRWFLVRPMWQQGYLVRSVSNESSEIHDVGHLVHSYAQIRSGSRTRSHAGGPPHHAMAMGPRRSSAASRAVRAEHRRLEFCRDRSVAYGACGCKGAWGCFLGSRSPKQEFSGICIVAEFLSVRTGGSRSCW